MAVGARGSPGSVHTESESSLLSRAGIARAAPSKTRFLELEEI